MSQWLVFFIFCFSDIAFESGATRQLFKNPIDSGSVFLNDSNSSCLDEGGENTLMTQGNIQVKRASLHTHGCRLNQYETKVIRDRLESEGYSIVPFGEAADLGVINTCTVTREADAKCRQSIRQFIKKNPEAITVVVGCYSQSGYKELADIPGIDVILGNQDKLSVLDYVGAEKSEVPVIVRDRISKEDFTINFVGDRPFNKRVNLKIQDGCDFMCRFCTIPFVRGRARSRDFDNLMEEARSLVSRGAREFVLTGVNIGTYLSQGVFCFGAR